MRIDSEDISVFIDYSSYFKVVGWAVNRSTASFPDCVEIEEASGELVKIESANLFVRTDAIDVLGYADRNARFGFSINMMDAFNKCVTDFGVRVDGRLIWTFSGSALQMGEPTTGAFKWPNETGGKQVFTVCRHDGLLGKNLKQLINWQPNFFAKPFNSGVSYKFYDLKGFRDEQKSLLSRDCKRIALVEKEIYPEVLKECPQLMSRAGVMVIPPVINREAPDTGLLNVACELFSIPDGAHITPVALMRLYSALSGFSPLFFHEGLDFYIYQSGPVTDQVKDTVRSRIQGQEDADIVLLANAEQHRLTEVREDRCTVFVRQSVMCRVMDAMQLGTEQFLAIAFARGLRVKSIQLGAN